MSWVFESALESFKVYRGMWDEISRSRGNHILLDSLFIEPLIRHFGSKNTLLGILKDSSTAGMILLERGNYGLWRTFQPPQAPIGLIVFENDNEALERIRELFSGLPGYPLMFSILQQDPDFTVFKNVHASGKVEILEYMKTARLTLKGTFEDYWKNRGRNLTHNLSRQRRRLAEQGFQIELRINRDFNRVDECIRDYGLLEQGGWKGSGGSAVGEENRLGLLYRDILKGFCERDEGVIYQLLMNGRTVASDLCLERDGIIVILKTAYDETVEGYSLGLLLHQEMAKALYSGKKIKVIEFYGHVREWHTKFTEEIRTMFHINFYRHDWVATVRKYLKASSSILRNRK